MYNRTVARWSVLQISIYKFSELEMEDTATLQETFLLINVQTFTFWSFFACILKILSSAYVVPDKGNGTLTRIDINSTVQHLKLHHIFSEISGSNVCKNDIYHVAISSSICVDIKKHVHVYSSKACLHSAYSLII